MDDRGLVAALVTSDPRGLDGAFRRYADRLLSYCRGLLRDRDAAIEAVHDTFVLASQRAVQLREPDRLRPWLYAIARNECLRLGRPAPAPAAEPDGTVELVQSAVESLGTGDREVFELVVRHELPAQDVSDVLGISVSQAHGRLARARAQLEKELGQQDPSALFAAYAAAPFPDVPTELWPRLELRCFDPGLELEREVIRERTGRFDSNTGFPRPRDVQRRRRLVVVGAVAVVVAALAAATAGAAIPPLRPDAGPPQAMPTGEVAAPERTTPGSAGTTSSTPAVSPAPSSPAATAAPSSPPPATARVVPPPPRPSLTLEASAEADCVLGGVFGYEVVASATASEPLAEAELFLQLGSGDTGSYPLEVDGESASGRSDPQIDRRQGQWWVAVTTEGGERGETAPVSFRPDC